MKTILKYITGAALMAGLAGCANDDFLQGPVPAMPEDGKLTIRYTVPEMQTVATRAVNPDDVDNLTLLIFSGTGVLKQVEDVMADLTPGSTTGSFTVTVDKDLRRDGDLKFRMVANVGSSKYTKTYFEGLKNTQVALVSQTATAISFAPVNAPGADTYMSMSGELSLDKVLGYNTMSLVRNGARISVNMAELDGSGNPVIVNNKVKKAEALPYAGYGTATSSSIFAGLHTSSNNMLTTGPASVSVADSHVANTVPTYVHATRNSTTGRAFVIVKAQYRATEEEPYQTYFYRLDYKKKVTENGKEVVKTLDIEPNHEYEFIITGVIGKGFATAAEAAKNPTPLEGGNISWQIYDRVPNVLNMVTDGTNYLGTSKEVNAYGNVTGSNVKSEFFYVHVSNKNGNYPDPVLSTSNFTCSRSWMSIGSITPAEDATDISSDLDDTDNSTGKLYKVELKITPYSTPGSQEGLITVSWNGLSREVDVNWNRDFDPSDLLKSVRLQVYKDGTTQEQTAWGQSDYFKFLNGNETTAPNVWGVDAESNNGHARNEGFHFPLMYGDNTSNPWTYKYTIVFNNQTDNNYKWRFSIPSVEDGNSSVIANNLKIAVTGDTDGDGEVTTNRTDTSGPTVTLTFDSKNAGWEYGVGTFLLEVAAVGTEDWIPAPLEVYHTGFFHKDDYTHAAEGSYDNSRGYTYYEVAGVAGQYWLDRNIGAHSAELYIESATGRAHQGTTEGRGAYYYVAQQVNKAPSFYTGICPPGYQIPFSSDWDNVRRSSSFISVNMGNYITAYFQTTAKNEDGTAKQVFFSMSRYMDGSTKTGDSLAGYYWSRTTATGFEKDEIGRWLRGFVLLGESNYHNNSRIDYNGGKSGFGLSLRCVNTHAESTGNEHASFFVKGATHVFAYKQNDDGSRVTVTSWPGVAIGNYNTAEADYLNFDYVGGITPEDLLLIFNFKDRNGQVTSVSRSGNGSVARITTNVSPNDLVGWASRGDTAPNGGVTTDGGLVTSTSTGINTSTTKYYWNLSRSTASDNYITNAPEASNEPDPPATFKDIYLRGEMTGTNWAVNEDYKMETTDGITYTLTVSNLGQGEFRFGSSDWSVSVGGIGNSLYWINGAGSVSTGSQNLTLRNSLDTGTVTFTLVQSNKYTSFTLNVAVATTPVTQNYWPKGKYKIYYSTNYGFDSLWVWTSKDGSTVQKGNAFNGDSNTDYPGATGTWDSSKSKCVKIYDISSDADTIHWIYKKDEKNSQDSGSLEYDPANPPTKVGDYYELIVR